MTPTYFFDTVKRSYTEVPLKTPAGNAEVWSALTADVLGSTAFSPVKSDLSGNVTKIRNKVQADSSLKTLEQMARSELADVKGSKLAATEGLLWLKRGLEFTARGIRKNVDNPNEELKDSFSCAYDQTLREFHSMLVRPIFSLAMKAVPKRTEFYSKLGPDTDVVMLKLKPWLEALETILKMLNEFYEEIGMNKGIKK